MKRIYWLLLFLYLPYSLSGQRVSDYGVFAGTSSYLGDINPNRMLYSPSLAAGILYRYNFNPRQALRTSLFYGGIEAYDINFKNNFQQTRKAEFYGNVGEWAIQFEFNFLPFSTQGKTWDYTPYLAAGVGIAFFNTTSKTPNSPQKTTDIKRYDPVIPFSIGFKVNMYKNLGLEAEYGFRKTFCDTFDGLKDFVSPSDVGWIHNNDWYSFAGVTVTWKIYSKLAGCPAYSDEDSKRKR
jgi:hypothetical protein